MVDTPNEEAIKKQYQKNVEQVTPKPPVLKNILWAFVVGGLICVIGQGLQDFFLSMELQKKDAAAATSITLVFLGAFLTGLGVYDEIGKRAGAGSIVPITGFANSIVACAMEFKRDHCVIIRTNQEYHEIRRVYAGLVLIFNLSIADTN